MMVFAGYKQKYGAKKINRAGYRFDSQAEAALFDYLKQLEAAGEISELQTQVRVKLSDAQIVYIADFKFFDVKLGKSVWAEFKGFETSDWRLKRRLWISYGPGILRIYKGSAARMKLFEELNGAGGES